MIYLEIKIFILIKIFQWLKATIYLPGDETLKSKNFSLTKHYSDKLCIANMVGIFFKFAKSYALSWFLSFFILCIIAPVLPSVYFCPLCLHTFRTMIKCLTFHKCSRVISNLLSFVSLCLQDKIFFINPLVPGVH